MGVSDFRDGHCFVLSKLVPVGRIWLEPLIVHRTISMLARAIIVEEVAYLTREEISVKEDVRKLLERLIRTIEPSAKLLSFGSTANGLNLKNSDQVPSASQFVLRAAQLLERETKFSVKPLPNARSSTPHHAPPYESR
ncbi:4919_t:CDS:2 [Acaulospora colombiana]|uniref:4919_t:CDS:1 n=1 Tax=Acaulospora colombiana TaxID=27376 RepID=A0ACA9QU34_9GLOM|nr:4919_t:CDS:2 [Acaulospora colombiana]